MRTDDVLSGRQCFSLEASGLVGERERHRRADSRDARAGDRPAMFVADDSGDRAGGGTGNADDGRWGALCGLREHGPGE